MHTILFLFSLVILSSQNLSNYTVSSDCQSVPCPRNSWTFNGASYSMACPKSGSKMAILDQNYNFNSLNMTAYNMIGSDQKVSIPLLLNQNVTAAGIQYFQQLTSDGFFVIFNCTFPNSQYYVPLCNKYNLVGTKIFNNTVTQECSFGFTRSLNEEEEEY